MLHLHWCKGDLHLANFLVNSAIHLLKVKWFYIFHEQFVITLCISCACKMM